MKSLFVKISWVVVLYSGVALGWGGALRCFLALGTVGKVDFSPLHANREKFAKLLEGVKADGPELIAIFTPVTQIRDLFMRPAGVKEGYSVIGHTKTVYETYNEQIPHHDLSDLKLPGGVSPYRILKAAIALHDIGKPAAVERGDKDLQHEYTFPIVIKVLAEAGLSPEEVHIIGVLIDNDALGGVVRDKRTVEETHAEIIRLAALAGLPPKDFLRLEEMFFIADANSYPTVRAKAFTQLPSGKMEVVNPKYAQLKALFP